MIYLIQKFAGHEWHAETSSTYRLVAETYVRKMEMECGGRYRIQEIQTLDVSPRGETIRASGI